MVYEDEFADLELEKVTRDDYLEWWRDRLMSGRAPRTVNRYVRAVTAGLNCAIELGHAGNPAAWRVKALADDVEDDSETAVFLTPEQRKSAHRGHLAVPPPLAHRRSLSMPRVPRPVRVAPASLVIPVGPRKSC